MTAAKFRIVLQADKVKDDVLIIQPSLGQHYAVTFRQETIGVVNRAVLRQSGIIPYIELFLDSVLADQNGFSVIQIDCPPFPTVILYRDSILKYMPVLRVQLQSIIENWPREEVLK